LDGQPAGSGDQLFVSDYAKRNREDQKKALETQAKKQGVSMGELVRRALDAYLKLKAEK
jgi:hypothetical protein